MSKKIIFVLILVLFWIALPVAGFANESCTEADIGTDTNAATATEEEAGFALLSAIVAGFNDLAESGTGGYDQVNRMLAQQMAALKKARQQQKIDAVFYSRYHRILEVLKLTIMEPQYDEEGILDTLISNEMKEFIVRVMGQDSSSPPPEHRGIGAIAGAIAEEILNLHIYLEGKKDRDRLLKKYMEWTKPPKE